MVMVLAPMQSHLPRSQVRACLAMLTILLALGFGQAVAQSAMQTILTNGPVSNRLNIVLLSEGYTTNQLPQFLVDATNAVNALLSHLPYSEYRGYCNAFAISVASACFKWKS